VLTWLLGITRNAAIDRLRLKRAEPVDPEALATRLQLQTGPEAPGFEDREPVRRAIASLAPDQRRALFLAAYYGRTAREIGELDHIPVGTAKSRIRAAMAHLRESLETADES
jgi:RNA polymerase sigma-70 factor (ECF subfamily)